MNDLRIKLSDKLVIREEDEGILLFHAINNAVIKLAPSLFKEVKAGKLPDTQDYRKVIDILQKNDMLVTKKSDVGDFVSATQEKDLFSNMFQLRSLKNPFNILWAITSRCNLKCMYCFPDVQSASFSCKSFPPESLDNITNQLIDAKVFQVTLTGGEALLEKNVWHVVKKLRQHNIKLFIISNGTTITDEAIESFKKYNMFVGVSFDASNEEVNAITRGAGVFAKSLQGIRALKAAGIPTVVLITLNRFNFPHLEEHVKFIYEELGIRHFTIQDLRPFGTKKNYDDVRLTQEQEAQLYELTENLQSSYQDAHFNLTELFILPHACSSVERNGKIMQCPAGYNTAYIDFYGDMYPCTHLPTMKLGNVLQDGTITELWRDSNAIKRLRGLQEQSIKKIPGCVDCSLSKYCNGGCRGDALFYNNDLYGLPSRCPKELAKFVS